MSVTPYVMVDDATVFGEFLRSAFDAELTEVTPLETDPQRTIHAHAQIGDGSLFYADSGPNGEKCLDSPTEPVHVQLWVTVPDATSTHRRAVTAGATTVAEVTEQDGGDRAGGFVDPFGTLWWISTPAS